MNSTQTPLSATSRQETPSGQAHLRTWDGSELLYRYWLPDGPRPRRDHPVP